MPDKTAREVTRFWIDEIGPAGWYRADEAVDATIRERFLTVWEEAYAGDVYEWFIDAECVLGFLILTDQFPRNMFRGDARSFSTDTLARTAAKLAIHRRWDLNVPEPERQFFYMPLMHSENLADQDRCIRLMIERLPDCGPGNVPHAKTHREIIRRFSRFPYRNAALGRMTLPAEEEFLAGNGYADILNKIQADAAS